MKSKFQKQLWTFIPFGTAIALGIFLAVASHALGWSRASTFVVGGTLAAVLGLLGAPLIALLRAGVPGDYIASAPAPGGLSPAHLGIGTIVVEERDDQPNETFLGAWAKNEAGSTLAHSSKENDWAESSFKDFIHAAQVDMGGKEPSTWEWGLLDHESKGKEKSQDLRLGTQSLMPQSKKLKVSLN